MVDRLNPDEATYDLERLEAELHSGGGPGADDNLVLDLGGVSSDLPKFEVIPAGNYNCIIENTEYAPSKAGNPMITWTLRVTDAPYSKRFLYYHTVLNSEAGLTRLKRLMVRLLPDVDLGTFRPARFCDEGHALGVALKAKVRIRQGRNSVTDVLAATEAGSYLLGD